VSVPRIKEKEFGLLPTPKARDHKGAEGKRVVKTSTGFSKIRKKSKVKYGASLNDVAEHLDMKMWRTPDAHCDRGASSEKRMKMKLEKKMPISINDQVAHPNLMWPTPRASNPGSRPNGKGGKILQEEVLIAEGIRKRGQKIMWPTPVQDDVHHRKQKYQQGGTALSTKAGGSLNPTWVEWLMGYPAEYTDLKHWETLSSHKSLKKLVKQ
jgi:hypothetical protein